MVQPDKINMVKSNITVPKNVAPVEKCICEICTCGHHRCPHTDNTLITDHIASELRDPINQGFDTTISTESREKFKTFNQIERQKLSRPKSSLRFDDNLESNQSYRDEFQSSELEKRKKFTTNRNEVAAGLRSKNQTSAAEIISSQASNSHRSDTAIKQDSRTKKFRQRSYAHRQADNGIFPHIQTSYSPENLTSMHNSSISLSDNTRLAEFQKQSKVGVDKANIGENNGFQIKGYQNENLSSGTVHDFGDVQGMTVVSQSRRSEGKAMENERFAEDAARFEKHFDGIDIESSLSNAKVKSIHEEEISKGTVKIGQSGLETSENTIKSITEVKSARIEVENSSNLVEIDERVRSSTISSDNQTFQFEEIPTIKANETVQKELEKHDIMNLETTHLIDYNDNYKQDLRNKKEVRVGQVLVEEVFDTDVEYKARNSESNTTHARQSENLKTTTVLEKSKEPKARRPKDNLQTDGVFYGKALEPTLPVIIQRSKMVRPKDNLVLEGKFYNEPEEKDQLLQKRSKAVMIRPKDTLKFDDALNRRGSQAPQRSKRQTKAVGRVKENGSISTQNLEADSIQIDPLRLDFDNNLGSGGVLDESWPEKLLDGLHAEEGFSLKGQATEYSEAEISGKQNERDTETAHQSTNGYVPATGGETENIPNYFKQNGHIESTIDGQTQHTILHDSNLDSEQNKLGLDLKNADINSFGASRYTDKPIDAKFLKGDRYAMKFPKDNLHGYSMNSAEIEEFHTGKRYYVQRPVGNEIADVVLLHDAENEQNEYLKKKRTIAFPSSPEKVRPILPEDNLRLPEGSFTQRPKEGISLKGDRYEVKKPKDNLKSEGEFYGNLPQGLVPAQLKRTPIKHKDHLKLEGEFSQRIAEEVSPTGERTDIKIPIDNLKMEGSFYKAEKTPLPQRGERAEIQRPKDNLKMEGEFYKKPMPAEYLAGERFERKLPKDNLAPAGKFYTRPKEVEYHSEKRAPILQNDNLKLTGKFYVPPIKPAPLKGERANIKRPEDNLKSEGQLYIDQLPYNLAKSRSFESLKLVDPFHQSLEEAIANQPERRTPIRQLDNLHLEGDFYRPPLRQDPGVGIRVNVKKPANNLMLPEGKFTQRKVEGAVGRGERADVKRPEDNLKLEGEFYKKPEVVAFSTGKRQMIKQQDNLHPEGTFYQRPKDENLLFDQKLYREHEDLKSGYIGGRRTPIRQKDNLHPEGTFYQRPKDENLLFDQKLYREHNDLKSGYIGGKRTQIRQKDNLHPEGEFYKRPADLVPMKGNRAEVRKPENNLRLEGNVEQYSTMEPNYQFKGEKAQLKIPKDNLKPEGSFYQKLNSDISPKIELRSPIRQKDNLFLEGEFHRPPVKKTCLKGERAEIKIPPTNLKMEGKLYVKQEEIPVHGERSVVQVPKDNLKPEGKFYTPEEDSVHLQFERPQLIVHKDNLHMEGKFYDQTTTSEHYNKYDLSGESLSIEPHLATKGSNNIRSQAQGSRATMKIPKNNLHLEGEMYLTPQEKPALIGERADIKIHEDNLQSTGKFYATPKEEAPLRGDRAEVKIPQDNLRLSSGAMDLMTTTQSQQESVLNTHRHHKGGQLNQSIQDPVMQQTKTKDESNIIERNELEKQEDFGGLELNRKIKGRRTTVENFTEDNNTGHIFLEKSIESSMEHETKSDISKDTVQKLLTQSMSAKSDMNQSILLQDPNEKGMSEKSSTQKHVHANKNSSHEVQVTRQVGITRRKNDSDLNDTSTTYSALGFDITANQHQSDLNFNKDTTTINGNIGEDMFASKTGTLYNENTNLSMANATAKRGVEAQQLNSQSRIIPIHQRNSAKLKSIHGSSSPQIFSNNQHNQDFEQSSLESNLQSKKRSFRQDNLIIPKSEFDGQTSSRSYGEFQSLNSHRVVPVRSTHESNISLGSYDNFTALMNSTSKMDFKKQDVYLCPASLLESSKSPFKYKRQTSNHRFYMPSVVS